MSMTSSEKIIYNCDVLQLIFHYLDFEDHLKLGKVCPQFEYAIHHGVWRWKCKNLRITRSTYSDAFFLQHNAEDNVENESLELAAIYKILHYSSMYIRKLELEFIPCLKNIVSIKYLNITELSIRDTVVENTHLKQVAENCLNLQSFTLIDFCSSKNDANIRPKVFAKMKGLNKLEIVDMTFTGWNYSHVQQLFRLAHLKTLIIDIEIRDSNENNGSRNHRSKKNNRDHVFNIENLKIGILPDLQSENIRFVEDIIRFKNLTSISFDIFELYDDVLTQINNACSKLCELSVVGCYVKFREFPRMNNLKHLTFERCTNISFDNFEEIFRKLKLKSLSLIHVQMRFELDGIFHYSYTPNTLETLNIEDIIDINTLATFINRHHKFVNVSKVRLLENLDSQSTELCFSQILPNLQELIMDSYYISLEDISKLQHLKILQFSPFDNMSWSYLESLFKHPTLTKISITPFHGLHEHQYFKMHYEHLPECCEGLTSTLEYLSLPSVLYEWGSSFWSSFRQRNKLLKLEIVD